MAYGRALQGTQYSIRTRWRAAMGRFNHAVVSLRRTGPRQSSHTASLPWLFWLEEQRGHAGLILIWSMPGNAFGDIVAGVERVLGDRPDPASWRDLVLSI